MIKASICIMVNACEIGTIYTQFLLDRFSEASN